MTTTPTSTRPEPMPVADWIEPFGLFVDPYDTYTRLRAESPVAHLPALDMCLVSTADLCRRVTSDPDTFSATITSRPDHMTRALGGGSMLRKDDPQHAAERAPINPGLRPASIRDRWLPMFRRNADRFIDVLIDAGPGAAELNGDVAASLAAQNLVDMLGFREVGPEQMATWSTTLIAGIGNFFDEDETWQRCAAVRAEIAEHLADLVPHLRSHPDASLVSAMAGSGIAHEDLVANTNLVISGGMNEPQHALTAMVWALCEHPQERAEIAADPRMWSAAFDETLRLLPPIHLVPREPTVDTDLGGVQVPRGSLVAVLVASANRDESLYEHPEVFDISRPKQPHLSFSAGGHLCAGQWAARIGIGEVAVPRLFERLPDLRNDESRAAEWFGWVFRGLTTHPVTW